MEIDSSGKDSPEDSSKDAEAAATVVAAGAAAIATVVKAALPEVEVYLSTLALTTLLRQKANADAVSVAPRVLERAVSFNRRCVG